MKRRLQFLSLTALALGATVVATPAASAQDAGTANLVIVHGLRGFTADLYVDGKLLINTFRPERSTDPMTVPAGPHLVEIREAGTGASTTPAVTATIDLAAGSRYDQATGLQSDPTKVPTGDGSVIQTPTESNGTGGEAIGLGAVAVFFAVATIRRLRRTA